MEEKMKKGVYFIKRMQAGIISVLLVLSVVFICPIQASADVEPDEEVSLGEDPLYEGDTIAGSIDDGEDSIAGVEVDTSKQIYSYETLETDIIALTKKYRKYCTSNIIGKSADGRNIREVIVGNKNAKKHLIVIANLHAREYMTTMLTMRQLEHYLIQYSNKIGGTKVSTVLNKVALHVVPSANPDGTAISQFGFNRIKNLTLRNNLKKMGGSAVTWKANARGTDLNRNWDIAFRRGGTPGFSGYHGTHAASESETKAIVKMVNRIQKEGKIVGVISYHSTGSIIYGRCASQATADVKTNTTKMYQVAQKLTSYSLMPAESIDYANSCGREYFLYTKKLPCITIEVGRNPCPLKISEFPAIWQRNKDLVFEEAKLFA